MLKESGDAVLREADLEKEAEEVAAEREESVYIE